MLKSIIIILIYSIVVVVIFDKLFILIVSLWERVKNTVIMLFCSAYIFSIFTSYNLK